MVYVVKVEIEGPAGLLARLTGKQPPDTRVWIIGGKALGRRRVRRSFVRGRAHVEDPTDHTLRMPLT